MAPIHRQPDSREVNAALHGLYDFLVIGIPAGGLPFAALLIAGIWIWRLRLIRDLHASPWRAGAARPAARELHQ